MERNITVRAAISGGLAGIANGLFGGGGGMLFVPLLTGWCGLDQRDAFATSLTVILPMCALSSLIYLLRGQVDLISALPYLIGGLVGGYVGGKTFRRVSPDLLRRAFALLILYGGVKSLL